STARRPQPTGSAKVPTRGSKHQKYSIVLDPPRSDSQSSEDEKTEAKKQDTVVDMTACIIENEFNKRWFTASEFYSVFSKLYLDRVSSDCPKDLITCERIIRTARHPNSKFKMFHRKKKRIGRVINVYYFYCFPIQQCQGRTKAILLYLINRIVLSLFAWDEHEMIDIIFIEKEIENWPNRF
ncbi:hypothetical protein RFI_02690, partial [Reticulomyxa filosa]